MATRSGPLTLPQAAVLASLLALTPAVVLAQEAGEVALPVPPMSDVQSMAAAGVALAPAAPVVSNPRYGVFYAQPLPPAQQAAAQQALGAGGWLGGGVAPSAVPGKVALLPLGAGALRGDALAQLMAQYPPGTTWYVGGEANVPTQGNMLGADYAAYFHAAATTIKEVDPTARVTAASVLNFVDTCRGCAGYTTGQQWVDEFRAAYWALYGGEPPVDVWAIDAYLLDWEHLPMIEAAFVPRQVAALRAYLDAIPEQAGKPIWLTEFGVIWAYEGLQWVQVGGQIGERAERGQGEEQEQWQIAPAGAFRQDLLEDWLRGTLDWLERDGVALGVERWFLFATQRPPGEPWYQGIELLETAPDGVLRLTRLGEIYAAYARGDPAAVAPEAPALDLVTTVDAGAEQPSGPQ